MLVLLYCIARRLGDYVIVKTKKLNLRKIIQMVNFIYLLISSIIFGGYIERAENMSYVVLMCIFVWTCVFCRSYAYFRLHNAPKIQIKIHKSTFFLLSKFLFRYNSKYIFLQMRQESCLEPQKPSKGHFRMERIKSRKVIITFLDIYDTSSFRKKMFYIW